MDIIGIYLFDQNMGIAFMARFKCTHIPLVLIFLGEMRLRVVKSRFALSPLASCLVFLADRYACSISGLPYSHCVNKIDISSLRSTFSATANDL